MKKYIPYLLIIIVIMSCTDERITNISGEIVNSNLYGIETLDGAKYKSIKLEVKTNDLAIANKIKNKVIYALIPIENRDIESLSIDDKKILEEFPIHASVKTSLLYYGGKNIVIINSVQDHIVEKW